MASLMLHAALPKAGRLSAQGRASVIVHGVPVKVPGSVTEVRLTGQPASIFACVC